jgi:hypothetical protein
VTTYPLLAPHIDEIIPKKEQLDAMKMYAYPSPLLSLSLSFPFFSLQPQKSPVENRIFQADKHPKPAQTE